MRKTMFFKMAAGNLKKNRQVYLPFILTLTGMAAIFDIMGALAVSPALDFMLGWRFYERDPADGGADCRYFLPDLSFLYEQLSSEAAEKRVRPLSHLRHGEAPCGPDSGSGAFLHSFAGSGLRPSGGNGLL